MAKEPKNEAPKPGKNDPPVDERFASDRRATHPGAYPVEEKPAPRGSKSEAKEHANEKEDENSKRHR